MNTAVAKHNPQGSEVAKADRVEANIALMADKFRPLLGDDDKTARFSRVAINAVQTTKDMELVVQSKEGRDSVYTACLEAATDNLMLDKKHAALVVYKQKFKQGNTEVWLHVAKYMPMYQGLLELAYEGGVVKKVSCQIVRAKDAFAVAPSAVGSPIHHAFPEDAFDRGDVRGVYAVAQFHDGTWTDAEVMSVDDVNKIRKRSKTGGSEHSPWATDWEEMARKTAIRRLSKYLPKSGAEHFHSAVQRLDSDYDFATPAIEHQAPRKQMMADKLLPPAQPQPAPPEPVKEQAKPAPEKTVEAKVEQPRQEAPPKQKRDARAEQEKREAARAAAKKPSPPVDEDMQGFDERGGPVEADYDDDWNNGSDDV